MAKYGSADVGIFAIAGFDLLGVLTQFTDTHEAITVETHTLGDAWVEHTAVGVARRTLTQQGFYDDGVLSAHEAMSSNLATDKVLCYGLEGNTSGKAFVGWSGALEVNYERLAAVGDLVKANAEYRNGNGVVEQGRIIRPMAGATASGNTTAAAIDFTASNTSGAAAYLQVISFSSGAGATALAVDLMHSADNLTFTSYAGFTNVSAAPAAQRVVSTAPIQRYAAAKWQGASGAGAPASAIFFVGLARK
jgi:hypothetical protein